jgi:hypothetical protein
LLRLGPAAASAQDAVSMNFDHDDESDYKVSIGSFLVGFSIVIGLIIVLTSLVVPIFEWALSYSF